MSTLTIRELDHIVLNVTDVETSLRFYTGVIGLAPERLEAFGRGEAPFPSVRVSSDTIIDLFPRSMHGQDRPTGAQRFNHFCIVADQNIEEIETHLRAHDISIRSGPVEGFGARGTGVSFYCLDPDGNTVEIRSYQTAP